MTTAIKYKFNAIDSARYEKFEKLPPELANDVDTINMWVDYYWQPTPDFVIDDLKEIISSYKTDEKNVIDAAKGWLPSDFKNAVAEKLEVENNIYLDDPEKEIGLCHGAADGFACIMGIFLEPGDEVLALAPQFVFAWGLSDLHQAKALPVPLSEERDWDLDQRDIHDLLERLITKKTKLMISTIPGNPTGTVFSKETTKAIGEVLRDHGIIYVEDAVYERRVFDDRKFVSMASFPEMRDWTVCLMGFSKIYNVSAFRVGYVVANREIIDKVWRWHMIGGFDPPTPFMKTMAKAYRRDMSGSLPAEWHERYRREWDEVRRWSFDELKRIPGVSLNMPHGGTYHFINISRLGTTEEVFTYLRDNYKVLLTPGTWYGPGGEGYMRLCYATNLPERTKQGITRVVEALTKLAKQRGIV
jgi:aspartate/methionine/tyrosine aminotransferase